MKHTYFIQCWRCVCILLSKIFSNHVYNKYMYINIKQGLVCICGLWFKNTQFYELEKWVQFQFYQLFSHISHFCIFVWHILIAIDHFANVIEWTFFNKKYMNTCTLSVKSYCLAVRNFQMEPNLSLASNYYLISKLSMK